MTPGDAPTLRTGFLRSAERYPDRPALEAKGESLSYAALRSLASGIAGALSRSASAAEPPLTAVFAHRSPSAFAGVLAALFRGHGYVPLNPTWPAERTRAMLVASGCRSLVVDSTAERQLETVLSGSPERFTLVFPELSDVSAIARRFPTHRVLGQADIADAPGALGEADPEAVAYLLFTSGSSGAPKGVMVAHRNVTHFLRSIADRYGIGENDRFSQMFDFTFDLSVFDMFVAWERGACVVCPSKEHAFMPYGFIRDSKISVWFSVPSVGVQMRKLHMLEPGLYPDLRLSLFCGERLPVSLVEAWALAAPNSIVENLYGPTEVTVGCTVYRWDGAVSKAQSEQGIVPIGWPCEGMNALVVDAALREVAPGGMGELLMSGPQVTLGYLGDPARTSASFVVPPGKGEVHYRTGDVVRRPHAQGPLTFLGRTDHQVKIRGYRVELGEIESALRAATGVEQVVAVGYPVSESGADAVAAFVAADSIDALSIKERLRGTLPVYMIPAKILAVPEFPLNANGKVDRRALAALLG